MGKLQERKKELRLQADRYQAEMEENLIEVRSELGEILQNVLIATGAGLGVWALGSGLAGLLGKSKKKKGRFGKAMVQMISPIAAKVIVDILRDPRKQENGEEKIDVATEENK